MKKMNKTAMLCLAFILVFSMMFTTGVVMAEPETAAETAAETPETTADGGILTELPAPVFELVAETEKVALYADKKLGEIKFVDKVTGLEWYSNPQDKSAGIDISEYKERTEFIIVTHKKRTMEYADTLYGITMQESGVSKLVSVKLDDIK